MPLRTCSPCAHHIDALASETKATRLDNLRKKIARNTLLLQLEGSARFVAYVMAEAALLLLQPLNRAAVMQALRRCLHLVQQSEMPPIEEGAVRVLCHAHAQTC